MDGAAAPEGLTTLSRGRLEAFSDGVIAVSATLLVLEIRIPEPGADVWVALREQLPSLSAYVVSFLTILIYWVNHHALFHAVDRVDRALMFVNGLLLLAISFISVSTAIVGRALQAQAYERSATALYAITLGIAGVCFTALWGYLCRHPELLTDQARPRARAAFRRSLLGPVLYAVACALAVVAPRLSLLVVALIAAYFAMLPRHLRRQLPAGE